MKDVKANCFLFFFSERTSISLIFRTGHISVGVRGVGRKKRVKNRISLGSAACAYLSLFLGFRGLPVATDMRPRTPFWFAGRPAVARRTYEIKKKTTINFTCVITRAFEKKINKYAYATTTFPLRPCTTPLCTRFSRARLRRARDTGESVSRVGAVSRVRAPHDPGDISDPSRARAFYKIRYFLRTI